MDALSVVTLSHGAFTPSVTHAGAGHTVRFLLDASVTRGCEFDVASDGTVHVSEGGTCGSSSGSSSDGDDKLPPSDLLDSVTALGAGFTRPTSGASPAAKRAFWREWPRRHRRAAQGGGFEQRSWLPRELTLPMLAFESPPLQIHGDIDAFDITLPDATTLWGKVQDAIRDECPDSSSVNAALDALPPSLRLILRYNSLLYPELRGKLCIALQRPPLHHPPCEDGVARDGYDHDAAMAAAAAAELVATFPSEAAELAARYSPGHMAAAAATAAAAAAAAGAGARADSMVQDGRRVAVEPSPPSPARGGVSVVHVGTPGVGGLKRDQPVSPLRHRNNTRAAAVAAAAAAADAAAEEAAHFRAAPPAPAFSAALAQLPSTRDVPPLLITTTVTTTVVAGDKLSTSHPPACEKEVDTAPASPPPPQRVIRSGAKGHETLNDGSVFQLLSTETSPAESRGGADGTGAEGAAIGAGATLSTSPTPSANNATATVYGGTATRGGDAGSIGSGSAAGQSLPLLPSTPWRRAAGPLSSLDDDVASLRDSIVTGGGGGEGQCGGARSPSAAGLPSSAPSGSDAVEGGGGDCTPWGSGIQRGGGGGGGMGTSRGIAVSPTPLPPTSVSASSENGGGGERHAAGMQQQTTRGSPPPHLRSKSSGVAAAADAQTFEELRRSVESKYSSPGGQSTVTLMTSLNVLRARWDTTSSTSRFQCLEGGTVDGDDTRRTQSPVAAESPAPFSPSFPPPLGRAVTPTIVTPSPLILHHHVMAHSPSSRTSSAPTPPSPPPSRVVLLGPHSHGPLRVELLAGQALEWRAVSQEQLHALATQPMGDGGDGGFKLEGLALHARDAAAAMCANSASPNHIHAVNALLTSLSSEGRGNNTASSAAAAASSVSSERIITLRRMGVGSSEEEEEVIVRVCPMAALRGGGDVTTVSAAGAPLPSLHAWECGGCRSSSSSSSRCCASISRVFYEVGEWEWRDAVYGTSGGRHRGTLHVSSPPHTHLTGHGSSSTHTPLVLMSQGTHRDKGASPPPAGELTSTVSVVVVEGEEMMASTECGGAPLPTEAHPPEFAILSRLPRRLPPMHQPPPTPILTEPSVHTALTPTSPFPPPSRHLHHPPPVAPLHPPPPPPASLIIIPPPASAVCNDDVAVIFTEREAAAVVAAESRPPPPFPTHPTAVIKGGPPAPPMQGQSKGARKRAAARAAVAELSVPTTRASFVDLSAGSGTPPCVGAVAVTETVGVMASAVIASAGEAEAMPPSKELAAVQSRGADGILLSLSPCVGGGDDALDATPASPASAAAAVTPELQLMGKVSLPFKARPVSAAVALGGGDAITTTITKDSPRGKGANSARTPPAPPSVSLPPAVPAVATSSGVKKGRVTAAIPPRPAAATRAGVPPSGVPVNVPSSPPPAAAAIAPRGNMAPTAKPQRQQRTPRFLPTQMAAAVTDVAVDRDLPRAFGAAPVVAGESAAQGMVSSSCVQQEPVQTLNRRDRGGGTRVRVHAPAPSFPVKAVSTAGATIQLPQVAGQTAAPATASPASASSPPVRAPPSTPLPSHPTAPPQTPTTDTATLRSHNVVDDGVDKRPRNFAGHPFWPPVKGIAPDGQAAAFEDLPFVRFMRDVGAGAARVGQTWAV